MSGGQLVIVFALFPGVTQLDCGIRGKADSDSDARRPLIPTEAGQ